jgi:tRNA dimethylallyltransferase
MKVVFIFGPTGVGKSNLACEIARGIGEIISVDSMQVYRGLDCGTAKPTEEQMSSVRHHLINVVQPDYRFSAGDFKRMALQSIKEIHGRDMIPIFVGGTGLYFRALEFNMFDAPPADLQMREDFYRREEKQKGYLFERLSEVDLETARSVHPNDLLRIVRALEIYSVSGKKFSDLKRKTARRLLKPLKFCINVDRSFLYLRLEKRCKKMIAQGLPHEVYSLLSKGYDERFPSMKGLGYSHFLQYFKGCYSYDETVKMFVRDTKRYAKRQLTWFRREPDTLWVTPEDKSLIGRKIELFWGNAGV